uniref:Uncharacterized protein n=1 Tax=Anguilla anguilla TaxID=7936 RepID=A0A0E9S5D8_ANGAN
MGKKMTAGRANRQDKNCGGTRVCAASLML